MLSYHLKFFVIQLSAGGAEGFYEVSLTVSTGTGNVPRVRAQRIKKGKPRSMDQSLSHLVEHTAEMTVACLLLFSIWTVVSGNSRLSVCIVIVMALGTSVALPACCCAVGCCGPYLSFPWGKPSGDRELVAPHATAPLLWSFRHGTVGDAGSKLSLIYHQCIYKLWTGV